MEISFETAPGNFNKDIGYGVAGYNIIRSLQALGHEVPYSDPRSPIQLSFCQPNWMEFRSNQYNIAYTPWESTEMLPEWVEKFNEADEVWTTSHWCKKVFEQNGINRPLYVYQHGIEDNWKKPLRRTRGNTLRFLHHGAPATRKGDRKALDAFKDAFGNQRDVSLTFKAYGHIEARNYDRHGNIIGPVSEINNVNVNSKVLDQDQLIDLYHQHDVMIYPSMGEGWGLIPMQALATGMPAVVTESWCEYKDYILGLNSTLGKSPWPTMHPGEIYFPDHDHLVWWFREMYANFETYANRAYNQVDDLYKDYNWITLTRTAFDHLSKKFEKLP